MSLVLVASVIASVAPSASAAQVWFGADRDQDGIRDDSDRCLDQFSPDVGLDYDSDGIPDPCDPSTDWLNPGDGGGGQMRFVVYLRDQYGDAIWLQQCSHTSFTWVSTVPGRDPDHFEFDDCESRGFLLVQGGYYASASGTFTITSGPGDCDGAGRTVQASGGPGRYVYTLELFCPDVDNDGLSSAGEYLWGTDPLVPDSDNDGVADGGEQHTYFTNPTNLDTDVDGFSDGDEIAAGTEPNDDVSYPGSGGGPCTIGAPSFTASWQQGTNSVNLSGSAANSVSYSWDLGSAGSAATPAVTATFPHFGLYDVTLTVTDAAGCGQSVTKPVVVDPVTTYAPSIHFHPEEVYFTGNVDDYLSESQLLYDPPFASTNTGCRDRYLAAGSDARQNGADQPLLTMNRLGAHAVKPYTAKRTVRRDGRGAPACRVTNEDLYTNEPPVADRIRKATWEEGGFRLNLLDIEDWRRGDVESQLYYEYRPGQYIIYWIFYPFNDWELHSLRNEPGKEVHESDWEHIVVDIRADDRMVQVGYAQHYCSPQMDSIYWTDLNLQTDAYGNDTHPLVYSALGGHASFPEVGDLGPDPSSCSKAGDRVAGGGAVLNAWEPDRLRNAFAQSWYGFGGSWGDRSPRSNPIADSYGPAGPGPSRLLDDNVVDQTW